nr:hypothetical protein [Tanacetum cinerariifolium]
MASAIIYLSLGRKFNFSKYIFDSLVRNVDSTTKFYMYPCFLQLIIRKQVGDLSTHTTKYTSPALTHKVFANMRRVGKGFSRVETPLFEGMLVEHEVDEEGDADENVERVNDGDAAKGDDSAAHRDVSAAHREVPTVAEDPSIPSPTPPTPPPQPPQDIPSTSQVQQTPPQLPQVQPPSPQPQPQPQHTAEFPMTQVPAATLTAAPARVIAAPSRRRKGVVIRDPEEKSTTSTIILVETKSKDKEDPAVKKYQAMKRKPQTEAQARKNMMMYLKNVNGFKMDYFRGMSYDDIRPIFEAKFNSNVAFLLKTKEQIEEDENRVLQKLNETPAKRGAKRRKLDEEVEELRRHL